MKTPLLFKNKHGDIIVIAERKEAKQVIKIFEKEGWTYKGEGEQRYIKYAEETT